MLEWHVTDAQSLASIDRELGDRGDRSPAEYELIRRAIYATADFDYASLLSCSAQALSSGAAALAARSTIVVDVPMVQVAIAPALQATFANPAFCALEAIVRPQQTLTKAAWGIQTLARRYPEAIFVIGQSQTALLALIELIEAEEVSPALVIATPAGFVDADTTKARLRDSQASYICVEGRKGSPIVAIATMTGLIDLAWQAYGPKAKGR
jgi:precorrin-8X/cobalt-precorrin-8 methylmutase